MQTIITDTDSLMYQIKTEDVCEDFSSYKEIFDFSNYSTKPKYYDYSNKLVIGKMKDETRGAAIGNFLRLKPKMYSLLVDNSEHKKAKGVNRNAVARTSHKKAKGVNRNAVARTSHKKAKGVNRNAVATTSHNEYKEVLLVNSKCIRH